MRLAAMAGILMLLAPAAFAADRPEVGPAPEWVVVDDTATELPKATQAPLQVLLSEQQVRITTDAVETYMATRIRIQTPQGLGAVGTLSFGWKPDSDVLTVHTLSVTRDGKTQDLLGKGEGFTILRREDQLEQAVLTGTLTAVLQPPGLQVGDVMEMSYTLRRHDPVVADSPGMIYVTPNAEMSRTRFRALWPENLAVHWRASKYLPETQPVKRNGWMELDYKLEKPQPLLQPAGAPGRYAALRMVELTTFADWPQLSRRFAPLYKKAATLEQSSPLRGEAARIRQQNATSAARAGAALRLVQDQIRYVLLAMNDGGLMPAAADETWKRRFGDCKAKTALLLALLKELGIEAEPALVSSGFGDGLDARLPEVALFDHVLVRAQIDGRTYWLDGTRNGDRDIAQIQPPRFIWSLPLTAKGSELLPIPREPLQEVQVERSLIVDATEGVLIPAPFRSEVIMHGDIARATKEVWDAVPEASRAEGKRTFWNRQYNNLELSKTDMRFNEQQGTLTMTAEGTMRLEWDDEYNTYSPPDMSVGYRADFSRPAGTDAEAPYSVSFPTYGRTREVINLPPGPSQFTVLGKDINTTVAGVEYKRKASVQNFRFSTEVTERSIAPEFPASQRAEAERVLLEMSRNDVYLKKPANYLPTAKDMQVLAEKKLDKASDFVTRAGQFMRRQMYKESAADYAKALELEPKNEAALVGRGMISRFQGKNDTARADFDAALAINPESTDARRQLSIQELAKGHAREVIALITPVLDKNPASSDRIYRFYAYALLDEHEAALKDIDLVLAANSRQTDAYYSKADELILAGRRAELPALADAMQKAFADPEASIAGPANLLRFAGEAAKGRAFLDAELKRKPQAGIYAVRANLQDSPADTMADIREAQKLESANPNPNLKMLIAVLLAEKKLNKEALEAVVAVEKQFGVSDFSATIRARVLWQSGQKTQALAAFAEARAKATDPAMINNICWQKATLNAVLDDALKDCDAALAKLPNCDACKDSRAFVLLRMGRFKESVETYDAALLENPLRAQSLFGRGIARLRLGDKEAGELDLKLARVISPTTPQTFRDMGMVP